MLDYGTAELLAELRPVTTLFISMKENFNLKQSSDLGRIQNVIVSMQSTIFQLEGFIRQALLED